MAQLERAANLFPFNRTIRTRPGYLAMQLPPSKDTVRILAYTLANDRNSSDLAGALLFHKSKIGE